MIGDRGIDPRRKDASLLDEHMTGELLVIGEPASIGVPADLVGLSGGIKGLKSTKRGELWTAKTEEA